MSLKLGNTNIAGTQVLYSTTGNNTDGAMTQNATTTQLNLKANDADVVHLTGNETISGSKLFEDALKTKGGLDVINNSVIKGTIPSSTKYWSLFRANDTNYTEDWRNTRLGIGEVSLNTTGDVQLMLGVYKNEASSNENSTISIKFNANGTRYVTAPASDINGSIVTTINKSKATNGYFQLGNGLIINWGQGVTYGTGFSSTGTTSFSKAFSNSTPVVLTTPNNSDYSTVIAVTATTSTNFKWKKDCNNSSGAGGSFRWIAIGY